MTFQSDDPVTGATLETVRRFNEAFDRHDVDVVMAAMSSPGARFTTEKIFAAGDRWVVRWRYEWVCGDGTPGHLRGVDLFRIRDGKVVEKLAYVKG